jgi:YesN/AraC family two-component response regulator
MALVKILIVDDDEVIGFTLAATLKHHGFDITTANNVSDALKIISSETFDVLLSDLHMPGAGDGLTVVSAMRHSNPKAVTMLLSAFPEMDAAAQAILLQTDQILVKPVDVPSLIRTITERLEIGPAPARVIESVAKILEASIEPTIEAWLARVEENKKVMTISLSREQRTGHLPKVLIDLVRRLQSFRPLGSTELESVAAHDHGVLRREQGYTAPMMIDESRMLQVSIFETLQKNLATIDFSVVLLAVMTIADEVDSQLSQAMEGFLEEPPRDALPAV